MSVVKLTDQEWQLVLACVAERPWREVNTVVMKIGQQLQQQAQPPPNPPNAPGPRIDLNSNGKEATS